MATREDERGVTFVEYALGIALVVLVAAVGVNALEQSSEDKLGERAAKIGTPTEGGFTNTGTGTPGGGGGGGGTGTTVTVSSAPVFAPSSVTDGSAPGKWIANVTLFVVDDDGDPVTGAIVSGDWVGNGGTSEINTCTTDSTGHCTVTRSNLSVPNNPSCSNRDPSITYNLTTVDGSPSGSLTVVYSGGTSSVTISVPSGACS